MRLKNKSKKIIFLVSGIVAGIILTLGACSGESAGARLLSGGNKQSIYSHGQVWHGVTEVKSFPGPDGQLAIQFAHKGTPHWCFSAGCLAGGANVSGTDVGATTRSAE